MPLQSYDDIEVEYGDDIDRICGDHENLIKVILEEEETLMSKHRKHIDDVVDIIKQVEEKSTLINWTAFCCAKWSTSSALGVNWPPFTST